MCAPVLGDIWCSLWRHLVQSMATFGAVYGDIWCSQWKSQWKIGGKVRCKNLTSFLSNGDAIDRNVALML